MSRWCERCGKERHVPMFDEDGKLMSEEMEEEYIKEPWFCKKCAADSDVCTGCGKKKPKGQYTRGKGFYRCGKCCKAGKGLTPKDIKRGHTYRAKRPRYCVGGPDDRTVIRIAGGISNEGAQVQFDGLEVKMGQHYPKRSMRKFLRWAAEDVTEERKQKKEAANA